MWQDHMLLLFLIMLNLRKCRSTTFFRTWPRLSFLRSVAWLRFLEDHQATFSHMLFSWRWGLGVMLHPLAPLISLDRLPEFAYTLFWSHSLPELYRLRFTIGG